DLIRIEVYWESGVAKVRMKKGETTIGEGYTLSAPHDVFPKVIGVYAGEPVQSTTITVRSDIEEVAVPQGVQRITNEFSSFTGPDGVTSIAAAICGRGGSCNSTNFPLAHRPGGGAAFSFNDSIPVEPGQSIRFRTTLISVGGVTVSRYEMYIFGVNGNATVLSALSGLPGDPPDNNGAGS